MRRLLVFILTFFLGIIAVPRDVDIPRDVSEDTSVIEIQRSLQEFWSASLSFDGTKWDSTVTVVPADYYSMRNRCAKGEFTTPNSGIRGNQLTPTTNSPRTLTQNEARDFYDDLKRFSLKIQDEKLSELHIATVRYANGHAVARIQYGAPREVVNDGYVLLTHVGEGWKVFAVDGGQSLSVNNRYFAQSSCEETAVTDLYWEPITY